MHRLLPFASLFLAPFLWPGIDTGPEIIHRERVQRPVEVLIDRTVLAPIRPRVRMAARPSVEGIGTHSLSGRLTDVWGDPVPRALIWVEGEDGRVECWKPDGSGAFLFVSAGGRIRLSGEAPGGQGRVPLTEWFELDEAWSGELTVPTPEVATVGLQLAVHPEGLLITGIDEDAETVGLLVGDVLVSVAGRDAEDLAPDDAERLLRGPSGTVVTVGTGDGRFLLQRHARGAEPLAMLASGGGDG